MNIYNASDNKLNEAYILSACRVTCACSKGMTDYDAIIFYEELHALSLDLEKNNVRVNLYGH